MQRLLSMLLIISLLIFPNVSMIEANLSPNELSNEVVIYIPGFLGSEIYQVTPPGYYNPNPGQEIIWPSVGSAKKRRLVQDENGTPVYNTFVGNAIERYAVLGSVIHDQTEALLNFLRDNDVTVITVPFDWRLDLSTEDITHRIDEAIDGALSASNGKQITIISHSTGGIVVRDYLIQNPSSAANVKNFINIGGPNLGSVKAMETLTVGMSIGFLKLGINERDSKYIAQNMTSIYQLLPGKKFVDVYKNYYPYYESFYYDYTESMRDSSLGIVSGYDGTDQYIHQYHNGNLYSLSKPFRNRIENRSLPSHIQEYRIIGYGTDTILSIMKYDQNVSKIPSIPKLVDKYRVLWGGGDGTVAVKSADFNQMGNARHYYFRDDHEDLLANLDVHNTIERILLGNPPQSNNIGKENVTADEGWAIEVSCPVDIVVIDSYGNLAKTDEEYGIINNIPGLSYEIIGESKHFFVRPGTDIQFSVDGYDTGAMDIYFTKYNGLPTSGIALKDIEITSNTKVNFDFNGSINNASNVQIHYDKNGDDNVQVLNPDKVFNPFEPPINESDPNDPNDPKDPIDSGDPRIDIFISGTEGKNNWVTSPANISIETSIEVPEEDSNEEESSEGEGNDEGEGEPIDRTPEVSYSINGGSESSYSGPFTFSEDGRHAVTVYVKDKEGSILGEATKTFKIDQTNPDLQTRVAAVHGENGWLISDAEISIGVSDETSKLERVDNNYNGRGLRSYQAPFKETAEGPHQIYAEAEDNAGNITDIQTPFKIDKTKPVIADVYLQDEYYWDQEFPIQFSVSDAISGVGSVRSTINGKEVHNGSTYRFTEPGWHTYRIEVKDFAGWQAIYETEFEVYIPAKIRFTPEHLQLDHGQGMATNFIELPTPFTPKHINFSTIQTNGNRAHVQDEQYGFVRNPIGDEDENGISDMMLKYERESLIPVIEPSDYTGYPLGDLYGEPAWSDTTITMFGEWGEYHFKGYDPIVVSNKRFVPPPPDETPPSFTMNLEDGAANVSVDITPILQVSESIVLLNELPITDNQFSQLIQLRDSSGKSIPFTANWMKNTLSMQVNPNIQLVENTVYTIEIEAHRFYDLAGNGNLPFTSSFRTQPYPIIIDTSLPLPILEPENQTDNTQGRESGRNDRFEDNFVAEPVSTSLTPSVSLSDDIESKDEEQINQAIQESEEKGIILLQSKGKPKIGFSHKQWEKLVSTSRPIQIQFSEVNFEIDIESLSISNNDGSYVVFEAEKIESASLPVQSQVFQIKDSVYHFSVKQIFTGKEEVLSDFNKPILVSLEIPETAKQAAMEKKIKIGRYNEDKGIWELKEGVFNDEEGVFQFQTDRFSSWSLMVEKTSFSDVRNHWASQEIEYMASFGYVKGKSANVFDPNTTITRAEFATMLANVLGLTREGDLPFSDVSKKTWYHASVNKAYTAGIINGYDDQTFKPSREITRQEMAVMISRALKYKGIHGEKNNEVLLTLFEDDQQIADWAKEAVSELVRLEIVKGKTGNDNMFNFAPTDQATRAEAIVILKNVIDIKQ